MTSYKRPTDFNVNKLKRKSNCTTLEYAGQVCASFIFQGKINLQGYHSPTYVQVKTDQQFLRSRMTNRHIDSIQFLYQQIAKKLSLVTFNQFLKFKLKLLLQPSRLSNYYILNIQDTDKVQRSLFLNKTHLSLKQALGYQQVFSFVKAGDSCD